MSSLQYTTVLVSVVIVSTGPIWVAILEVVFLKIRLSRLVVAGLLTALAGGVLIGIPLGGDAVQVAQGVNELGATVTGAVLAWIGALSISVYMLIGRKLRATLPVVPYVWLVYGAASIFALTVIVATTTPVAGFRVNGYLILLAMGLVPQLLGHSSLNYLLELLPGSNRQYVFAAGTDRQRCSGAGAISRVAAGTADRGERYHCHRRNLGKPWRDSAIRSSKR